MTAVEVSGKLRGLLYAAKHNSPLSLPTDVREFLIAGSALLAVAEAAQVVSLAQRRMLKDWSESDELVRKSLWVQLHAAGKSLFDALDALAKVAR